MKRITETAKVYQLEHGHTSDGELKHGLETTKFKYGTRNVKRRKTEYVHGMEGGQTQTEIETVCFVMPEIGDKVMLATGQTGIVTGVSVDVLDELQLRFVGFEKADKITHITIEYV